MPTADVVPITARAKAPHPFANVIRMDTRQPVHGNVRNAAAVWVETPDHLLGCLGRELDRGRRLGIDPARTIARIGRTPAKTLAGLMVKAKAMAMIRNGEPVPIDVADEREPGARLLVSVINDLITMGARS